MKIWISSRMGDKPNRRLPNGRQNFCSLSNRRQSKDVSSLGMPNGRQCYTQWATTLCLMVDNRPNCNSEVSGG